MKRIAIITPCILPVPASMGGAVEGLITRIIEDNEQNRNYDIDLFTIDFKDEDAANYSCTNLIKVKPSKCSEIRDRILDKYYRTVSGKSSGRTLDGMIVKAFSDRLSRIQGDYDAVIIENMMSTACEIERLCKGRYEFPIYFHMHNDVDIYRSPDQIKELVRGGVQFIAVSEYIKSQILKCDKDAIVSILYNGVDLTRYDRSGKNSGNTISLLYAGRIIPGKGVKELVQAFKKGCESLDAEKRSRLKLTIVGFSGFDKGYEYKVKAIADKFANVECIDQVPAKEMPSVYDKADIVVMPTMDEEPFGTVALETMAKGIPLIVTDSGGLPEVVGDGAHLVSRAGDVITNLSEAILKISFDESYRKELSKKGYDRARSITAFDIKNYYSDFEMIIDVQEITDGDKISVIIPVYNVSSYIKTCVSSVTGQTYTNLEIILIDDGSTDGSGEICDELAASDNRIKVIHQENSGLSRARNTGLQNAAGRYIFFCDSDDYLQSDALERMLLRLKRDHADIVACGISNVFGSDKTIEVKQETFTDDKPGRWSGRESVIQMMRTNNVCTVIWNKLYKRELFDGIEFPPGVQNEDEATTYKILYKAGIVSYMPETFYRYYQRESSIMHEELKNRYKFFLEAALGRIEFFHENGDVELEQHSKISLLEWIKYCCRNIGDNEVKKQLVKIYRDNCSLNSAPSVMGVNKRIALLAWKYFRY